MKILLSVCAALAALGIAFWIMGGFPSSGPTTAAHSSPASSPDSSALTSDGSSQKSSPATNESTAFEARAEAIEEMPRDGAREKALRTLAQEWTAQDPTAAENWAAALADAPEQETALTYIALAWADTDPGAAIGMAQRDHLPPAIIDDLAHQWGEQDFPAAQAWASQLSPGPLQDETLAQILVARAETDPAAAAALVSQKLPPGPVQEEAVMTVLYEWLRRDESAAAAWVAQFPAGQFRTRADAEVKGFLASQPSTSPPPTN